MIKFTAVIMECGHIKPEWEPELFVWDGMYYCEDCKTRRKVRKVLKGCGS